MVTNYDAMARVLRFLKCRPHKGAIDLTSLASGAGLDQTVAATALTELGEREFVQRNLSGYWLPASSEHIAGSHAGQLLAIDLRRWIVREAKQSLLVEEIPNVFRANKNLFELALEALRSSGALEVITERRMPYELRVRPGIEVFEFGPGVPLVAPQVHTGDVITGSKFTNMGSGAQVIGAHANVQVNHGTSAELREYIDGLRSQQELNAQALRLLDRLLDPELTQRQAIAIVADAAEADTKSPSKLVAWLKSLPSKAVEAAMPLLIESALKANGYLQP